MNCVLVYSHCAVKGLKTTCFFSLFAEGQPADAGRRALLSDGEKRAAAAVGQAEAVSAPRLGVGRPALPPAADLATRAAERAHAASLHPALHPGLRRHVHVLVAGGQRAPVSGVPPQLGGVEDSDRRPRPPHVQPGHRYSQQLCLPHRWRQEHQRVPSGDALLEVRTNFR